MVAVLVQLYDEFGNSQVSSAQVSVTVALPGASPPSISLNSYAARGTGLTRRYSASLPPAWFATAATEGTLATVSTVLSGQDAQSGNVVVYGTPAWFDGRPVTAGIAGYMSSDEAGTVAASAMRAGDIFYLQLYAHTGGAAMDSFEVKLVVDPTVCELIPQSGAFSASYTGDVQGQMDGSYSTELLKRYHVDGSYFTKYQRLVRLNPLTSTFGNLGWVRLRMVSSGACLSSATITAFYAAGTTAYVSGVAQDDPVALNGNEVILYADVSIGVLGELSTRAPVVNTATLSGVSVGVNVHALHFRSPDQMLSSNLQVVYLGGDVADGDTNATVSLSSFSHAIAFTVIRPAVPTLRVDDAVLQALPATCGGYQHTRLWAVSNGADISRLVVFGVTDGGVASVERPSQGHPTVSGIAAGTALIYVKDVAFASVAVTVSDAVIGVVALRAGVVTGVTWAPVASIAGPFLPIAMHEFTSETSVGWLYVHASFNDGTAAPVVTDVTATAPSPMNASITVSFEASGPPVVSVRSGANSQVGVLTVSTCAGDASAVVNLTLPPPVSVIIRADRYNLVPDSNVAREFSGRHSEVSLQTSVRFADGATRDMQTDSRVVFAISDRCGSFSNSGHNKLLIISPSCRQVLVTVSVTVTIGGVSVSASQDFSVEWLTGIELQLFHKDESTAFTTSELRRRYACSSSITPYHPSFHSLRVRTRGTLSSGAIDWIGEGITYTVNGASLSGSGMTRTLSVTDAGIILLDVVASPNPDGLSASTSFTAISEPDAYTFEWSLGLTASTVSRAYLEEHPTTTRLLYATGYLEIMSDDEKRALVTFGSTDSATVVVSERGALQPLRSAISTVNVSAVMCDGQNATVSVHVNLRPGAPFDYDLGSTLGAPISYTTGDSQLCVPIQLYTQSVVSIFQFVLRFDANILECSASSCGTWTAGSAWGVFADSVAYAPDAGQVDFLTTGSVAALGQRGLLDIGTLCLNVIGSGMLRLQVQMQAHNDATGSWSCSGGGHLYEDGSRCMSRTPEVAISVSCTAGCASRRLVAPSSSGRSLQSALAARLRPFNIDTANTQQMNLADCLYLGDKAAEYANFAGATQAFIDSLGSAELAISYNPTLDYYVGTSTPLIDPKDAVYCILYVAKRFRFVYDATIACTPSAAVLSLEVAGGKVGDDDQAEFFVPSPSASTSVSASVAVDCGEGPSIL